MSDAGDPGWAGPATPGAGRMRRQLIIAVVVAIVSSTAAIGSIAGQGIAYRQMRAIERISEQISERCGR